MTAKGRIVGGFTFGPPLFYLSLIMLAKIFMWMPTFGGARDYLREDVLLAIGFAITGFILALVFVRHDPELRAQTLFEPEPAERTPYEKPAE